jgi:hypothetical protein
MKYNPRLLCISKRIVRVSVRIFAYHMRICAYSMRIGEYAYVWGHLFVSMTVGFKVISRSLITQLRSFKKKSIEATYPVQNVMFLQWSGADIITQCWTIWPHLPYHVPHYAKIELHIFMTILGYFIVLLCSESILLERLIFHTTYIMNFNQVRFHTELTVDSGPYRSLVLGDWVL